VIGSIAYATQCSSRVTAAHDERSRHDQRA
jgi:hypothetical protein